MFALLRGFLPHFFTKEPIPQITNPDLLTAITRVRQCSSETNAMETAVKIVAARFTARRFETYLLFPRLYEKDPNVLWNRSGFMHCTHQNFLVRVLLTESGWVEDKNIELGFSLVWYVSPHQFLKVTLDKTTVALDPWNYHFGAQVGQYATGFGVKSLNPIS